MGFKENKKLLILIPAFNEESVVADTIKSLPSSIGGVDIVEVLVIDDGSKDNTVPKASQAGAKIISHSKNLGVGMALTSGIEYALNNKADILISIDADGQFSPEEIKQLISPIIKQEADFVSGNRFENGRPKNMSLIKYWGNKAMTRLINYLSDGDFKDVSCGFRAYNKEALLNLNLFGRYTYTQETFLDLRFKNLKIKQVPVSVEYFKNRKSKVAGSLLKYAWKSLNIIVRSIVYYKPLRFFGYSGIILLSIGFAFIVFLFGHKILVGDYTPYKAFGFIGASFSLFGLLMILVGLVTDILDKIRRTQEKILYYEKKDHFGG